MTELLYLLVGFVHKVVLELGILVLSEIGTHCCIIYLACKYTIFLLSNVQNVISSCILCTCLKLEYSDTNHCI